MAIFSDRQAEVSTEEKTYDTARNGGAWHRLGQGDGTDSWGHAIGRGTGWIRVMGLIYGGARLWLDRGDGIGLRECTVLAGSGRWD